MTISKRLVDIILSLIIFILIFPFICLLVCLLFLTTPKIIYFSKRIGKNKKIFLMPKFRTMLEDTPQVATHLLQSPDKYYTKIGFYLRKFSLDEIPQLYSVITGDMSLVGPRPALFNQYDLINLRENHGINNLVPGITGLAQVNGRDNLSIKEKVYFDHKYKQNLSFYMDIKILFTTFLRVIQKKDIIK